jgi:hypothetical protein
MACFIYTFFRVSSGAGVKFGDPGEKKREPLHEFCGESGRKL